MNVGAGHIVSNKDAITTFPIIPPSLAATIEIATPVALQSKMGKKLKFSSFILQTKLTLNGLETLP